MFRDSPRNQIAVRMTAIDEKRDQEKGKGHIYDKKSIWTRKVSGMALATGENLGNYAVR